MAAFFHERFAQPHGTAALPRAAAALTVAAGLALAAGCTTSHPEPDANVWRPPTGGSEPIDYDAPIATIHTPDFVSRFPEPDRILWQTSASPALSVSLTSLEAPPDADGSRGEVDREALQQELLDGMSLWRVRDGARVPAEPRLGFVAPSGTEMATKPNDDPHYFSLVPESGLEDGWYLFRVDLTAARERIDIELSPTRQHQQQGNVLFARVYKGSRPMWTGIGMNCTSVEEYCQLGVGLSEPTADESPVEGRVTVYFDGEPVECALEAAARGFGGRCPYAEPGTEVTVDLITNDAVTPSGTPLVEGDTIQTVGVLSLEFDVTAFVDPDLGRELISGP